MQALQLILLIIFLLKYNLALKSCTEKHEKLAVCFTNIEGYVEPIPADLGTKNLGFFLLLFPHIERKNILGLLR